MYDKTNPLIESRDRLTTVARKYFSGFVTAGVTKIDGELGLAVFFTTDPPETQTKAFTNAIGDRFEGRRYKLKTLGIASA